MALEQSVRHVPSESWPQLICSRLVQGVRLKSSWFLDKDYPSRQTGIMQRLANPLEVAELDARHIGQEIEDKVSGAAASRSRPLRAACSSLIGTTR